MTRKQELIKELENYEEFFHIFGLEKDNIEYREEKYLSDCLDDCIRMRNNIERLTKLGINI